MVIALYLGALVLIVVGLVGAILPALPGIPLIFAGIWMIAAADGYRHLGKWWLISIAAVGCVGLASDLLGAAFGAKRVGASRLAIVGAIIGMVIGIFFGVIGLLVGPFLGALAGELASGKTLSRSAHVGVSTWIGLLFGALMKLVTSFMMIAMLATAWLAATHR
jgi:uncharacterized protein